MSSLGFRQAELERQRREELRLEQTRGRARGLVASCQETIRAVTDPAVQQLAAKDLRQIQQTLTEISMQITSAPDAALKTALKTQKHLNKVVAQAESAAQKWSKQQAEARAQLEAIQQSLKAEKESANTAGQEALAQAEQMVAQARSLYQQGRYEQIGSLCRQAEQSIQKAGKESFDESVRKEVVKGLLGTLMSMGFVIEGPQLNQDGDKAGVVTLSGRMPSGKMARFEVNLDGRMQFDFEGYEGRACAKDLEKINATLQEQFAVKLTGSQIIWKNPDKIAKGARDLPSGSRNTIAH
jgi:hypothetical protein